MSHFNTVLAKFKELSNIFHMKNDPGGKFTEVHIIYKVNRICKEKVGKENLCLICEASFLFKNKYLPICLFV